MSIKLKINLLLLVIGLITSLAIGTFNYFDAKDRIITDAYKKAELISSFAMASRNYTVDVMRPLALNVAGRGSFHPELMGGFYVAKAIADNFSDNQAGYTFKQATLDPVNPENLADAQEREIIRLFSADRDSMIQKGVMEKNRKNFIYIAQPVIAKKGCLKCHGNPKDAFTGRVERYPGAGGYNYTENDVVATFIAYVPIQKALENLRADALKTTLASIFSILIILVVVWLFLEFMVTRPIVKLTNLADSMSRGKNIDKVIKSKSKDEIGALYDSYNRMRISVIKLFEIIKKKKKIAVQ